MFVWPNRSGYPMVAERLGRTPTASRCASCGTTTWCATSSAPVVRRADRHRRHRRAQPASGLVSHLLSASIVDRAGRRRQPMVGSRWPTPARPTCSAGRPQSSSGRPFVDLFDARPAARPHRRIGDHDAFLAWSGMIGERDESPARDWTWRTRARPRPDRLDDAQRDRGPRRGRAGLPVRRPRRHRASARARRRWWPRSRRSAPRSSGCARSTGPRTSSSRPSPTSCARR